MPFLVQWRPLLYHFYVKGYSCVYCWELGEIGFGFVGGVGGEGVGRSTRNCVRVGLSMNFVSCFVYGFFL